MKKSPLNEVYRLLMRTKLKREDVMDIYESGDKEYRVYTIPKTDGGKRTICEPSARLKYLQKNLTHRFILRHKVAKHAKAYEKGASIKENARVHIRGRYILHIDMKNFFPSVHREMVEKTFRQRTSGDHAPEDLFWRLVSYQGGLPIGAPSSPFIANRVCYGMDKKLARLGGLFRKITYTRYADDMIFSSRRPLSETLVRQVEAIVAAAGFCLNKKKTYFMHNRREVTGIILTDDGRLSVGTAYKKRLKQDIYNLLVKGAGHPQKVAGRYAHLKHIEPDYAAVIKRKYQKWDTVGFF